MKKTLLALMVLLSSSTALANDFWKSIHDYVINCAVQPYAVRENRKIFSTLRSTCIDFRVYGTTAQFVLNGIKYRASLYESDASDDGDLDFLIVESQDGTIHEEKDFIPSFGDIILALAGGDDNFPLVYDPLILTELETEIPTIPAAN
jgi:hypothetical protein